MMQSDIEKLEMIIKACPALSAICLDVANGYSEHFVEFAKQIRQKFPEHIIIVSYCRVWSALIVYIKK